LVKKIRLPREKKKRLIQLERNANALELAGSMLKKEKDVPVAVQKKLFEEGMRIISDLENDQAMTAEQADFFSGMLDKSLQKIREGRNVFRENSIIKEEGTEMALLWSLNMRCMEHLLGGEKRHKWFMGLRAKAYAKAVKMDKEMTGNN
jgi:hypothetical protein